MPTSASSTDSQKTVYMQPVYTRRMAIRRRARVRIIVPLTRDVTPDEFVAISRYFADEWGIDQFDECSYRPHQLMYYLTLRRRTASISANASKARGWTRTRIWRGIQTGRIACRFRRLPGKALSGKAAENRKRIHLQEGVIGAFCRTYGAEAAITTFLSDVYEPSLVDGRYDYIPADSSAGVVIYDDKFAYSHHATDPACGKLLNAFDLVRIHKFGDDDDKKSLHSMMDFASKDDQVKLLMTQERVADASQEFDELERLAKATLLHDAQQRSGKQRLESEPDSEPDPDFAGFAYNELANRIQVTGDLPWERPEGNQFWRDADTAQLKSYLTPGISRSRAAIMMLRS